MVVGYHHFRKHPYIGILCYVVLFALNWNSRIQTSFFSAWGVPLWVGHRHVLRPRCQWEIFSERLKDPKGRFGWWSQLFPPPKKRTWLDQILSKHTTKNGDSSQNVFGICITDLKTSYSREKIRAYLIMCLYFKVLCRSETYFTRINGPVR